MPVFPQSLPSVDAQDLVIALVLGALLSSIVAWQYVKFGRSLSNRSNVAYIIPLLTVTIVLIISVVKASIALSLGLVGALSIVRFRTPVKETEELVYLFIAIAIGIGLGANQTVPTVIATGIILLVSTARVPFWKNNSIQNLYLNIDVQNLSGVDGDSLLRTMSEIMSPHVGRVDLRRFDIGPDGAQATFYIKSPNDEAFAQLIESLRNGLPASTNVTFIEQDASLGA